jgi:DNA-binding transcriptional LysR family regulator
MELRHLRYFVTVAEELHFTRAAERLHIGQPPLSQQIQALEAELGVQLFQRSKRRVLLTTAGERLLLRARRLLADAEAAAEEARRAGRGEVGELRIAFTSSMPLAGVLPDSLRHYRERYPAVSLKLEEMFSGDQYLALQQQRLDVGFVRYNGDEVVPGIHRRELRRDRLCVVIRRDHPLAARARLAFAELRDEGFIGFQPRIAQTSGEAMTQIALVAAGLGIAILPSPLACVQLDGVCYIPLTDAAAYLSMAVATREQESSPLVAAFLDVLPTLAAIAS